MNIPYASRSGFTAICKDVIDRHKNNLYSGHPVNINLNKPGGYAGRVKVTISAADPNSFDTDWQANDPTRFPARIKAAATALHRCSHFGRFEITHKDGIIVIKRN